MNSTQWAKAMLEGDWDAVQRAMDELREDTLWAVEWAGRRMLSDLEEAEQRHRDARKESAACQKRFLAMKEQTDDPSGN